MKNSQITATTVKLKKALYDDFKVLGIRSGLSLQSFAEKCVYLYVNDIPFQQIVNSFSLPILSTTGSFEASSSFISASLVNSEVI